MSGGNAAVTPGELIRARLEDLGWTQADLAFILGVTDSNGESTD